MEILLVLALCAIAGWWFFVRETKDSNMHSPLASTKTDSNLVETKVEEIKQTLDVNQDGKVDVKDAVEVVKKTRTRVKKVLDKDGDGKVTVKDAKTAVKKAVSKTKTSSKPRAVARKSKSVR